MPPKETAKKPAPQSVRPPVSDSSLLFIAEDVVEGFLERLETGVQWTLLEKAARHHRLLCTREDTPNLKFAESLDNKIKKSILDGFLKDDSGLTFEQQWEFNVPITTWDVQKFGNDEEQICFKSANSLTDDLIKIIKRAARFCTKENLMKELKEVALLRVIDSEMTHLDKSLLDFVNLTTLNLCGNYITEVDAEFLPTGVRALELQANGVKNIEYFAQNLPENLLYMGLARNLISDDNIVGIQHFPASITVLDLSENDIYNLEAILDVLVQLPSLNALHLAGNPCSLCAGYARVTLMRLPRLQWLDAREVLPTDRSDDPFEPHPDDLRATYFNFTVIRIMSAPQPPKPEKGAVTAFYVELEIPLLDKVRRQFLMYRRNESLVQMLPPPEDGEWLPSKLNLDVAPSTIAGEQSPHPSDIYNFMTQKNEREVRNFTTFESNKIQWNKMMNFQEPAIRIFCPDLRALRDTFRSEITVRFIYSVTYPAKQGKPDKRSNQALKPLSGEYRAVLASVRCALRSPDWSQPQQHFHWDDTMETDQAIHWGEGNLSAIQYTQANVKTVKTKSDADSVTQRQQPENLTCHFGFGIDSIHV